MTDERKLTEIHKIIAQINDPKILIRLGKTAFLSAKNLSQREADKIGWFVGQKVQLKKENQAKRPHNAIGIVTKVNQKKLKVDFDNTTGILCGTGISKWTVPKTMLQTVG